MKEVKWLEDFLSLAPTRSFSRSASERFCTYKLDEILRPEELTGPLALPSAGE